MPTLSDLKRFYGYLKTPSAESLSLSMADTHHVGLFSLVIHGTEFGKLTRVFIADTDILPYEVQLHTHRYPIKLTTIKGEIKHYVAYRSATVDCRVVLLSEFKYKSPLNGGNGLSYIGETNVIINDNNLPPGSTLEMTENDFHTVSCKIGAIWIVEEQGFKKEHSRVLGTPFITDGLYNPPSSFQINDKHQIVLKEVKKMLLDYETVL